MMDSELITAVTNVGFPIVMCLLFYAQTCKQSELHKQEIDELKTAIENNTLVIQQLIQSLGKRGE